MGRDGRPAVVILVILIVVGFVVIALGSRGSDAPGGSPTPPTTRGPASAAPSQTIGTALADLAGNLRVDDEHRAGYDRDRFEHWIDADGDGCDTRREVLIAEAIEAPIVGQGCWLSGGSWFSVYDGLTLTAIGRIDVDHVVALAEAWDSGAWRWTDERRRDFANDLGVDWALAAVSASSNRAKSDLDPADWLPGRAEAVCPFVTAWISVKARWALAVDQDEADALVRLAGGCPDARPSVAPAP